MQRKAFIEAAASAPPAAPPKRGRGRGRGRNVSQPTSRPCETGPSTTMNQSTSAVPLFISGISKPSCTSTCSNAQQYLKEIAGDPVCESSGSVQVCDIPDRFTDTSRDTTDSPSLMHRRDENLLNEDDPVDTSSSISNFLAYANELASPEIPRTVTQSPWKYFGFHGQEKSKENVDVCK